MATVTCPKCATTLRIPAGFTGTAARCPKCRAAVAVPREEDEEEVIQAVEVEEEDDERPRPKVRAGAERRKPRLTNDDEDDRPRRRAARDEDDDEDDRPARVASQPKSRPKLERDEDEDDRPRRRRDEDDEPEEDDRPRRKRRRPQKERPEGQGVLLAGIGVFLFACLVVFFTLGIYFKNVSYAMLILGAALIAVGTQWIRTIAKEEGFSEYMMCLFVPFYETWYTMTRLGQTWIPCLLVWGGRFFVTGAVILLIMHFFRDAREGRGAFAPGAFQPTAAKIDAEAEDLLRQRDTFEAKAWLGDMNRRRAFSSDWGRPAEVQFVNDLYARGAVKVSVADIDNDPEMGEMANHLVITMPTEPEKRQAVLTLINQRMRGDSPRADRQQKYEILTP